ncbi:MAG TPA: hypothetical protein VE991_09220 [Acidimicrobiales bacterium]|nr:hypothetical protein [Acidimicrobiales bacterium]
MSDEATPALHATRRRGPGLVPTTTANRWQDRARQLAVRYVPFLAVLAVLLALVAEAPTTRASAPATPSAAAPSVAGGGGPGTAPGAAAGAGGTSAAGPGGAASAATAANPYARSGVKCGPAVLQVPWSPYAPPCVPAWHGNNGGATAPGVSSTTITIAYREEGEASDVSAVRSVLPGVLPTDAQALFDLNVLLQAFNNEFELYGRKVVVKPYPAQGDALQEMVGEDTQGAQEDAATAASMGAFADITPLPTPLYAQALVQNHVVSFDNLLLSNSFLTSSAPYAYTLVPSLDLLGHDLTAVGCTFGRQPVSYAKDGTLNGKPRVYGIITLEDPQYQGFQNTIVSGLKACGDQVPVVIDYSLELSQIQQQMQNAIAQMQAAHVTTVVCGCDPVGEIYATQAADQQNYGPEWFSEWLPYQFERLMSQDQWAHSIEIGLGPSIPEQQVEGYRVFKMVDPNGQPAEELYDYLYYELLFLFDGLQAAGPDLTPATLLAGFQHLPLSQPGQAGTWQFGPGIYWPFSQAQVSYWNPTRTNANDGNQGDYSPCFGGQWFSLIRPALPSSLDCPGLP